MTMRLTWSRIQTVLLDMDGTLLDLRFDNHFWRELVPARYAERHGLPLARACAEVADRTRLVEGTLAWYCLDYWSRELALDIVTLKREIEHLIAVHPHVVEFLAALRVAGKRVVLVTNAHPRSLALKMEKPGWPDTSMPSSARTIWAWSRSSRSSGHICANGSRSNRWRRCWWTITWRSCARRGRRGSPIWCRCCGRIPPSRPNRRASFRRSMIFPSCGRSVAEPATERMIRWA